LNYWKDRVSQDFLPPIDPKKNTMEVLRLQEEISPSRLVNEATAKRYNQPAFKIKVKEKGYNEEEQEKNAVDKLPLEDRPEVHGAAGNGKLSLEHKVVARAAAKE